VTPVFLAVAIMWTRVQSAGNITVNYGNLTINQSAVHNSTSLQTYTPALTAVDVSNLPVTWHWQYYR